MDDLGIPPWLRTPPNQCQLRYSWSSRRDFRRPSWGAGRGTNSVWIIRRDVKPWANSRFWGLTPCWLMMSSWVLLPNIYIYKYKHIYIYWIWDYHHLWQFKIQNFLKRSFSCSIFRWGFENSLAQLVGRYPRCAPAISSPFPGDFRFKQPPCQFS